MEAPIIIFTTISWQYKGRTVCENKHHLILNRLLLLKAQMFKLQFWKNKPKLHMVQL